MNPPTASDAIATNTTSANTAPACLTHSPARCPITARFTSKPSHPVPATKLDAAISGRCLFHAHGAFDMDSIAPFAEALDTAASKHTKVVVDASAITFADSTFLNLLLRISQQTDPRIAAPAQ
ncbi:STAS domain-containing protein [Streptomyces sp. NPDC003015]